MRFCLVLSLLLALWPMAVRADEVLRQVQEELRKRKVYFGDIDGRETSELRAALSHYQESRGLSTTGRVSAETLDTLDIAVPVGELGFPDGVVLRSDPGPKVPARETPAATPTPELAPSPGAEKLSKREVEKFLKQYLADSEGTELEAEVGHYAPEVDYFDHGEKPLDFVRKDVASYRKRWPERQYRIVGPVAFEAAEGGLVDAHFTVEFDVQGPRPPARGKTKEHFQIDTSGDKWLITGMKEQRIRK